MASLELLLFCLGVLIVCFFDIASSPTFALLTTGSAMLLSPQALFCLLVVVVPVPPKAIRNACLGLSRSLLQLSQLLFSTPATTATIVTATVPVPISAPLQLPTQPPKLRKLILAEPTKHIAPRYDVVNTRIQNTYSVNAYQFNRGYPPFMAPDRRDGWLESYPRLIDRSRLRQDISRAFAEMAPKKAPELTVKSVELPKPAIPASPPPPPPPPPMTQPANTPWSLARTLAAHRPHLRSQQEPILLLNRGVHKNKGNKGGHKLKAGLLSRQSEIAMHLEDVRIRAVSALPVAPQSPPPSPPPPAAPAAPALTVPLQPTSPAGPWEQASRLLRSANWRAACGKVRGKGKGKDFLKCERSTSFKVTAKTQTLLRAKVAGRDRAEADPMEWEWETTAQLPAERAPMPMPIAKPTVVVAPTVMSMAHVLAPVSMPAPSISVPVVSKTRSPPAQPAPVMSVALPPMRVRRAGEPVMPQQSLPAPTPARAPAPVPIPAPTPAPATLMPPPVIPAPVTPMGPPPRPAPVAHMAPPPMPTSPNTISPPTVPAAGVRSVPGKKIALWLEPLPDHVQVGRTFTPMAPMMAMPAPHPQPRAKPKPKPQPAKPPTPPPVDAVDADYDSFEEEYEAGVAEELGKPVPEKKKRTPPAPAPGGAAFKFDVTALSFAPPPATGAAQGMLKLVSKKGTVLRGKTVGPEAEKLRARRRLERLDRDDPDR